MVFFFFFYFTKTHNLNNKYAAEDITMNSKTKVTKLIENDETFYLLEKNYTHVLNKNRNNVETIDYFIYSLRKHDVDMDVANSEIQMNGTSEEKMRLSTTIEWKRVCATIVSGERDCNSLILKIKPAGPMKDVLEQLIKDDNLSMRFRGTCTVRDPNGQTYGERINMKEITTFEITPFDTEVIYPTQEEINENKHNHT